MSTFGTLLSCIRCARQGLALRDRRIAFLLAGYGVLGHHRQNLRRCWLKWIRSHADGDTLEFSILVAGKPTLIALRSEADYLIACELVRGSYELPPSAPRTILDAGANIGLFALHAARHFPEARLTCYEPDPANFQFLERNLARNGVEAILERAGVWSRNGILYYHERDSHTGFIDENPPGVEIPCALPAIEPGCWMKLDVEGSEYEVLPALFALGHYPEWISMEIHHFDTRGHSLLNLLRTHRYRVSGGENPEADCVTVTAHRIAGT